ncbi:hypothetical protein [Psychroflexus sp. MES1-P1E]|uniref:hypothetical protein n=1 Tax=Psychroflexus sp. MES1-P1E TaxID=2058320 RepID=UPI000C7D6B1D|nr:hypothetical protein [Psychroflexus sp. MES1-P1E]PKG44219.1 hypothetical protein CXF67_00890 [Psychroflexus sp. MES1-P1E]
MSEQTSQNASDEIDLGVVFEKIKSFFKSILIGIIQIFQFFWKHKFVLAGLIVIGVGLQLYLKSTSESIFSNQFLVKTNYSSTEYLYSKVNSINLKLKAGDSLYIKDLFGEHYDKVKEIEVVPVIDVYGLVNKSKENKETFELLLDEFGNISFLSDEININEYTTHKIKIYIEGQAYNEKISNRLYDHLASNSYYNELKTATLESYKERLQQNKAIRTQIDSILKDQKENTLPKLDNNAINFSGSQDLKELLNQKQELLLNDLSLRNRMSSNDEVLKIIDSSFGVFSEERNQSYLIIPSIFLGIYFLFFFFRYLSRRILSFVGKD